jgi:PEP-CTERM/exosortase A-associated glycosyltransferase
VAILHVVQFALPEISSGYTIRTAALLREQQRLDLDPIVVTSPTHPGGGSAVVEGVIHYRSGPDRATRLVWLRDAARVGALARRIQQIGRERGDVKLVHAHSPVLCGMAAVRAGRALGLSVVYEVRGLWEEAMVGRSLRYRVARAMEARVCRQAGAVVAISEGLKRDFVRRGIPEERIHVIPNGVDSDAFQPTAPDAQWRVEHGLGDCPVVLYLGALRGYEGVDLLFDAFPMIRGRFPAARLVVVGDGEARQALAERARGLGESVVLLPPVAHAEVRRVYAAADVVVYPRRATRETELVTPLKPLEAMAMGKPIVASDVGGLRELLSDGKTARMFPAGSAPALAEAVGEVLSDGPLRARLGETARQVAQQRDWRLIVPRYREVYAAAASARSPSA